MIIYLTTNNIKGKVYVGKYCGNNEKYLGSGKYIKRAIKKYGKENFSRIILEDNITDHDYLCEREIYWIDFYDATDPLIGYNLGRGGRAGNYGHRHTDETIKRMSDVQKDRHPSEETRKNMSISAKNRLPMTEETRNKMSESAKNRPTITEETREKMRENHADINGENHPMFGKHHSEETRKMMSISAKSKPPVTEETKKKMSKSAKNKRPTTEETRKKMSEAKFIKKEIVLNILWLLNKGMTQTKIAKKIHISRKTIRKVKNGFYDNIYDLKIF